MVGSSVGDGSTQPHALLSCDGAYELHTSGVGEVSAADVVSRLFIAAAVTVKVEVAVVPALTVEV